jgi:hypothetical protein
MIELRWMRRGTGRQIIDRYGLDANEVETVLQYRQKVDTTVRAGMWSDQDKLKTAHWEWSDWQDVPTVDQASGRVSK